MPVSTRPSATSVSETVRPGTGERLPTQSVGTSEIRRPPPFSLTVVPIPKRADDPLSLRGLLRAGVPMSISRYWVTGYSGLLAFLALTKCTVADSGTVLGEYLDDHFPVESRRRQTFRSVVVCN